MRHSSLQYQTSPLHHVLSLPPHVFLQRLRPLRLNCSLTRALTPDERPSEKRNQPDDNIDAVLRASLTIICTPPDPEADIGRVVANELRQITDDQKKIAKKLIYDTLYLGSTASLNKDH